MLEIFITLVEIFHVYYTCGKRGVTLVGNFFITLVGNFITLVGIITLVGKFITLVGVITSKKIITPVGPTRWAVLDNTHGKDRLVQKDLFTKN